MKHIFLYLFLLCTLHSLGQETRRDTVVDGKTFSYVEVMPKAPYDMYKYLSKNMHYPKSAKKRDIEGRVIVKFVVMEDGSISDCTVVKGIDEECDAEALRVVREMPDWQPGMQNGKPVKVYFNLPIMFKLEGSGSKKKNGPRWKKKSE